MLNEFGGQETNLGESRRSPVVCMLINSHDLFNGVAVSEGVRSVERLSRGKHWAAAVRRDGEENFSFQAKPRRS